MWFLLTNTGKNMRKISVIIANRHSTSICLEDEFYNELKKIANEKNISINALITEIDAARENENLSSAIRVYILKYLLAGPAEAGSSSANAHFDNLAVHSTTPVGRGAGASTLEQFKD